MLYQIISTIGIAVVIGALIYIGRKLQMLDTIQEDIKENLKPDLKNVRDRLGVLEGRLGVLEGYFFKSKSV